jgi:WD40 repeat protein
MRCAATAQFASGGWDARIHLWDATIGAADSSAEGSAEKKRKVDPASASASASSSASAASAASASSASSSSSAAAAAAEAVRALTPTATLTGHSQAVTALSWPAPTALYSGGYDHNIKLWDTTTGVNTANWVGAALCSELWLASTYPLFLCLLH